MHATAFFQTVGFTLLCRTSRLRSSMARCPRRTFGIVVCVLVVILFQRQSTVWSDQNHSTVLVPLASLPAMSRNSACYGSCDRILDGVKQSSAPVYGLFTTIDFRTENKESELQDWSKNKVNRMMALFSCWQLKDVGTYRLYFMLYSGNNQSDAERRRIAFVTNVTEHVRHAVTNGCVITWKVIEVKDASRDVLTLNSAMMDAHLDDGVDYFYIALGDSNTVVTTIAGLHRLSTVLQTLNSPSDHGIIAVTDDSSSSTANLSLPLAVFFSRTHFDVFGLFFPLSLPDVRSAVTHCLVVYSVVNLSLRVVADGGQREVSTVVYIASKSRDKDVLREDLTTLRRYLSAVAISTCLRCPVVSTGEETRIIAMSLYGSSRRYTMGAIRNAQLAPITYPNWRLRFYAESPGPSVRYGSVPPGIIARLLELGAEIRYVNATVAGDRRMLNPRLWRFTVVDDEQVDVFIVRDCDSRLTSRDAAVVADWLKQPVNESVFHCIRDHPSHTWYPISAGLWGGRRRALAELFNGSFSSAMFKYGDGYIEDTNFLHREVWRRVQSVAYCHDSFSCTKYPASHPFPVVRLGSEHLGQVYDQFSVGRQGDIAVIVSAAVSHNCIP